MIRTWILLRKAWPLKMITIKYTLPMIKYPNQCLVFGKVAWVHFQPSLLIERAENIYMLEWTTSWRLTTRRVSRRYTTTITRWKNVMQVNSPRLSTRKISGKLLKRRNSNVWQTKMSIFKESRIVLPPSKSMLMWSSNLLNVMTKSEMIQLI